MKRHKVALGVALPTDAKDCEACVARLTRELCELPHVLDAHIDLSDPDDPRLCLHYDPSAMGIERVESMVARAGAELISRYEHLSVAVEGLRHERQRGLVESALAAVPGVLHVALGFGSRRLLMEYDPEATTREAIVREVERAGITIVDAQPRRPEGSASEEHREGHHHGGPFGERSELVFSLTCGGLTAAGWLMAQLNVAPAVPSVAFVLAYGLGAWFPVKEVVVALRARQFEIDFLMLLAAAGAAVLGEWFEGALLLFLFTLGHALERFAMSRARAGIEALQGLVPETALRIGAGEQTEEVAISDLEVGDRILVKPNTSVPADGFVASGTSSVNQAPVTGESVPVDKSPVDDPDAAVASSESLSAEHRVFAGTINGSGVLTVVVTKAATESTLARVVQLVAEAESQKSPTQRFTQRFERAFVPAILGVVVLLLFAPLVLDEPFSASFYRAMAVLVAASPCALAIATPSAVLAAVARASRSGVLIKGGAHLEALGQVRAIAFDKTGTLTQGRPKLTDVVPLGAATKPELLRAAAAVERQSDHPIARAIVEAVSSEDENGVRAPEVSEVEAIVGFGVRAKVDGKPVVIGKPDLFTSDAPLPKPVRDAAEELYAKGRTVMLVRSGEEFLGALGVMDAPRREAPAVIESLRALGIDNTVMLTGDHQRVADAVAREVGLQVARGDLLPEQKVEAIAELARTHSHVAMVGDGVNDAPAMAKATVAVAMGAAGSDVALETAGVALMADDLNALPFAVGLSRAARRIIRQNLWASLGMVAFLVPATITGFAGIGIAVALHEGSTLIVVANALRLLAHRDAARPRFGRTASVAGTGPKD